MHVIEFAFNVCTTLGIFLILFGVLAAGLVANDVIQINKEK